jgi:hypothetical protein
LLSEAPHKIWSSQQKERKAFLLAHNWELDHFPFIKRMWWGYFLWPYALVETTAKLYAFLLFYHCLEGYCVATDKLFGGSRIEKFDEVVNKKIASMNERNRQARKRFEDGLIKSTQVRIAMENISRKGSTTSKVIH